MLYISFSEELFPNIQVSCVLKLFSCMAQFPQGNKRCFFLKIQLRPALQLLKSMETMLLFSTGKLSMFSCSIDYLCFLHVKFLSKFFFFLALKMSKG